MRIVLRKERKLHTIDDPIPVQPAEDAPLAQHQAYKKLSDEAEDVACLMLATISQELQTQLEKMVAKDMIEHLKGRFEGNRR